MNLKVMRKFKFIYKMIKLSRKIEFKIKKFSMPF